MKHTVKILLAFLLVGIFITACVQQRKSPATQHKITTTASADVVNRVKQKKIPAIFQAWNPLDMPEKYPVDTLEQRLQNAAKHSLLWEEPVSQLGFNTPLVLGLVWDHKHVGLATRFTEATLAAAKKNRARLLELNPAMVFLMEIRWRDAPGSYLPIDSDFWLRDKNGERIAGWKGGPEPYYMLNYKHEGFQDRIAEQSKAAVDSGIYDGVMLDWSGHLPIVKKVRQALGNNGLITINIHDDIEDGEKYKEYINGSFMECSPEIKRLCSWEGMRRALMFFETEFQQPTVNALEAWGERGNKQWMRAVTTLGLTHSDAYVLYADPNPLKTPDHMHDWYYFWDVDLGAAKGSAMLREDGVYQREFEKGIVVYNPPENKPVEIKLKKKMYVVSIKEMRGHINLPGKDGEIFLHKAP